MEGDIMNASLKNVGMWAGARRGFDWPAEECSIIHDMGHAAVWLHPRIAGDFGVQSKSVKPSQTIWLIP